VRFPAIEVYQEDEWFYVADGFHRTEAMLRTEQTEIDAIVRPGGLQAAILASCAANQQNGAHRTNADKQRAVERMLRHYPQWSDRRIARHCAVSPTTVGSLRPTPAAIATAAEDGAPPASEGGEDLQSVQITTTAQNGHAPEENRDFATMADERTTPGRPAGADHARLRPLAGLAYARRGRRCASPRDRKEHSS